MADRGSRIHCLFKSKVLVAAYAVGDGRSGQVSGLSPGPTAGRQLDHTTCLCPHLRLRAQSGHPPLSHSGEPSSWSALLLADLDPPRVAATLGCSCSAGVRVWRDLGHM